MAKVLTILLAMVCSLQMFIGCATVDITKTSKGVYDATKPDDVEILMTKPSREYVELATISTSNWDTSDTAKMHNALRAKAAPLGANAVILLNSGISSAGGYSAGTLWATGVAIRWK